MNFGTFNNFVRHLEKNMYLHKNPGSSDNLWPISTTDTIVIHFVCQSMGRIGE